MVTLKENRLTSIFNINTLRHDNEVAYYSALLRYEEPELKLSWA
jgi:hypothetical protein